MTKDIAARLKEWETTENSAIEGYRRIMTHVVWPLKEYERAQERKAKPDWPIKEIQAGMNKAVKKLATSRMKPKSDTKELLRSMGAYFELKPESVNFWIRQQEMSGKL